MTSQNSRTGLYFAEILAGLGGIHQAHDVIVPALHSKDANFGGSGMENGTVLRGKCVAEARLDLEGGDAGSVPTAAKSLYQENAGDQFLPLNDGHFILIVEEILLGADDIEIADEAADVAAVGKVQRAASGIHGLLLGGLRFGEDRNSREAILNFLKGAENSAAIVGDSRVVAGLRKLLLRASSAAGEDALRHIGADRPERAGDIGELGNVRGLPAAVGEKIEGREKGGPGDADLRVGSSHLALGFGDIGAALEKIGGKAGVDGRRLGIQLPGQEVKVRSGMIGKSGDGIFVLFALLTKKDGLGARRIEKRFFLSDIETGGDTASVASLHETKPLIERSDGAIEDANLGVKLSERKIVTGELGSDEKADILEIRCGGLVGSLRGFDAAAAGTEEIGFVANGEGDGEGVLRGGAELNRNTIGGTIAGKALPLSGRSRAELGEFRGDLECRERAGLFETPYGNFDGLVFGESLLLERVELIVVEDGPPLALRQGIARRAFAPGLGDIPVSGDRSSDALIIRADRAAGKASKNNQAEERGE